MRNVVLLLVCLVLTGCVTIQVPCPQPPAPSAVQIYPDDYSMDTVVQDSDGKIIVTYPVLTLPQDLVWNTSESFCDLIKDCTWDGLYCDCTSLGWAISQPPNF